MLSLGKTEKYSIMSTEYWVLILGYNTVVSPLQKHNRKVLEAWDLLSDENSTSHWHPITQILQSKTSHCVYEDRYEKTRQVWDDIYSLQESLISQSHPITTTSYFEDATPTKKTPTAHYTYSEFDSGRNPRSERSICKDTGVKQILIGHCAIVNFAVAYLKRGKRGGWRIFETVLSSFVSIGINQHVQIAKQDFWKRWEELSCWVLFSQSCHVCPYWFF